jgi:hypothetical protein
MASTLRLREVSSSSTFRIRSSAGATWGPGSSLLLDSDLLLSPDRLASISTALSAFAVAFRFLHGQIPTWEQINLS